MFKGYTKLEFEKTFMIFIYIYNFDVKFISVVGVYNPDIDAYKKQVIRASDMIMFIYQGEVKCDNYKVIKHEYIITTYVD